MTVKAITFLGLGPYYETAYLYNQNIYTEALFPLALAQFCKPRPEEWIVCVTKESKKTEYFQILQTQLDAKPFPIPWGKNDEELWQIFNALVDIVEPGDQVIFDITHGLRSLPLIVFLASAYLKSARSIQLEGIFYGAFDVRNRDVVPNQTPVFELTPFISLLDWLTATERFTETGDGRPLANLLQNAAWFEHPRRKLTKDEQIEESNARKIRAAAHAISNTSGALLTTLIPNAQFQSHLLNVRLDEAEEGLFLRLPPYRILAQQIRNAYSQFAREQPMTNDIEGDLGVQLAMLRWYIDNGQLPQAVSLMREWVVTAVGYRLGMRPPQLLDYKTGRKHIENAINLKNRDAWQPDNELPVQTVKFRDLFEGMLGADEVANFWHGLIDIRNLVDHGAMRKNWRDYDPHKIADLMKENYDTLLSLEKYLLNSANLSAQQ